PVLHRRAGPAPPGHGGTGHRPTVPDGAAAVRRRPAPGPALACGARMTTLAYLGKGWTFPVVPPAPQGALAYQDGPEKVRQSIELILDTEPGERVMRPTFGGGLRRFLMQPNTVATRALIQHDVELALASWEPRIQVTQVSVAPG